MTSAASNIFLQAPSIASDQVAALPAFVVRSRERSRLRSCSNRVRIFIENGGANSQQNERWSTTGRLLQDAKTMHDQATRYASCFAWDDNAAAKERGPTDFNPANRCIAENLATKNRSNAPLADATVANTDGLSAAGAQTNHLAATSTIIRHRDRHRPRTIKRPATSVSNFAASIRPHDAGSAPPPDSPPKTETANPGQEAAVMKMADGGESGCSFPKLLRMLIMHVFRAVQFSPSDE